MLVQKDLSNKIYNAFIKLLEDIPQKDIPIKDLIGKMDLRKQINIGEIITLNVTDAEMIDFNFILKINILLALIEIKEKNIVIIGAALDVHENSFHFDELSPGA